jgi:glucose/arabinose dehydrogenase
MRFALSALAAGLAAAGLLAAPAGAQVKIKLEEVASGLTHPLALVSIPDGSGRKAVIEQHGQVRIIDARGRLLPEPFLNIQSKLVHLEPFFDEQGLLGIAFHPNYRENGKFYIAYSAPLRGDAPLERKLWWAHTNTISEMTVSKDNPNKANATRRRSSRRSTGRSSTTTATGSRSAPTGSSTSRRATGATRTIGASATTSRPGTARISCPLHGKMLRFRRRPGGSYPDRQPFVGRNDALPQIWALGLRNPWRCSFDMAGNRELYCGDVQQNAYEEVSLVTKGGNYGWRKMEADKCFDFVNPNTHPASCDKAGLTDPISCYKNCTAIPQGCQGISSHGRIRVPRSARALGRQVHLR